MMSLGARAWTGVVALALVMALPVLPLSLTVVPVAMLLGKVVQLLVSGH